MTQDLIPVSRSLTIRGRGAYQEARLLLVLCLAFKKRIMEEETCMGYVLIRTLHAIEENLEGVFPSEPLNSRALHSEVADADVNIYCRTSTTTKTMVP